MDSFGTLIPDVSHNGIFRFGPRAPDAGRGHADAPSSRWPPGRARRSPWRSRRVGCRAEIRGDRRATGSTRGWSTSPVSALDHFVIDGGVLVNRPIEPALNAMFADGEPTKPRRSAVSCCTSSRIRAGRPHADAGRARDPPHDAHRGRAAQPGDVSRARSRSPGGLERPERAQPSLVDGSARRPRDVMLRALVHSRRRRLQRWRHIARGAPPARSTLLLAELTRRWLESMLQSVEFDPVDRQVLRRSARGELAGRRLPAGLPSASNPTPGEIAAWGIDSVVRAATVTLDLAQRGHSWAAPGSDARKQLAKAKTSAHEVLKELRQLRAARRGKLRDKKQRGECRRLGEGEARHAARGLSQSVRVRDRRCNCARHGRPRCSHGEDHSPRHDRGSAGAPADRAGRLPAAAVRARGAPGRGWGSRRPWSNSRPGCSRSAPTRATRSASIRPPPTSSPGCTLPTSGRSTSRHGAPTTACGAGSMPPAGSRNCSSNRRRVERAARATGWPNAAIAALELIREIALGPPGDDQKWLDGSAQVRRPGQGTRMARTQRRAFAPAGAPCLQPCRHPPDPALHPRQGTAGSCGWGRPRRSSELSGREWARAPRPSETVPRAQEACRPVQEGARRLQVRRAWLR